MGPTSNHIMAVAAAASKTGGFPVQLILIVVVMIGVYMLMIRPQRRRQQQIQKQQNSVRPGARVRTTAGMYATVVAVDDEAGDVVLEVAPGVESRFMKRAIMDVITNGDEPEEPEAVSATEGETESATDGETAEDSETASPKP